MTVHRLKTASDDADATWRARSFQTVAPETGNARLPTVERQTFALLPVITRIRGLL